MQRDDRVPLKEVYETPEALREKVERIIDLALYEVSYDSPLRLRFITPVSRDQWLGDENYNDYRLTTPEEHQDDMDFVTVSYCWKHTQSTKGLSRIPQYCISKSSEDTMCEPRPISCPELVFHRAMLFARSRKCQFLWIDQECIDQSSSADIQSHLKIMHRIYEESKWTVAILSVTITDHSLVECFVTYIYFEEAERETERNLAKISRETSDHTSAFDQRVQGATTLLHYITQDMWFSRTWAYQEKRCASTLFLLVPIEESTKLSQQLRLHTIGTDLCFEVAHFNRLTKTHREDNHYQGYDFYQLTDDIHRNYTTSWDRATSQYGCYPIFRAIQDCENLVVADRIAIFGHVCGFLYQLESNILHSARFRFSACVIALLLANVYVDRGKRFELLKWIWQTLEEHSKVQTAEPDLGAWILVLLDSSYRLPKDHAPEVRAIASTNHLGRRRTM
ncbi:hypothetical protein GT037_002698 [Alternaria burnsii]|uniref:Heterokaryon incompatibility domain-containing protein n=1 Tax=Alternaria burnsii TaxID=1187904 RepID=A0A8H7BCR5_9PLEO|nr:uncharacterized protein GT037_002698 [Alternaria burnsii]KAF7678950.1 hypothetical protein GT037_002698 [Alternaria burnsii]